MVQRLRRRVRRRRPLLMQTREGALEQALAEAIELAEHGHPRACSCGQCGDCVDNFYYWRALGRAKDVLRGGG